MRSPRVCVFCGQRLENKTSEHVIPRWLIEMTGDPGRMGHFGPIWNDSLRRFESKTFAFDSLKFPACADCNGSYSEFEGKAKVAFLKLSSGESFNNHDAGTLLSWLDKIRVGMWLGNAFWWGPASGIEPHMSINSRIDMADRCVLVYRSNSTKKKLHLVGFHLPAFQFTPCCCSLIVNNIGLFNLSGDFLFSKRLGLPYPRQTSWGKWPEIKFDVTRGTGEVTLPLITKPYNTSCQQFFQPMATRPFTVPEARSLYSDEYSKSKLDDSMTGTGKVFTVEGTFLNELTSIQAPPALWPKIEHGAMVKMLFRQTIEFQLYMGNRGPAEKTLAHPHRRIAQIQRRQSYAIAKDLLARVDSEM